MFKRAFPVALILCLVLASQPEPARAFEPGSRIFEPANLAVAKKELANYVNTGEYAKAVAKVALQANKYLVRRINKGAPKGKKMAIVFDIDETTLTNLSHIVANDYGYVPRVWNEWVAEGRAPAIFPIQTVYDTAIRGKVDVFFITGRTENQRAPTIRNLHDVGYETWTGIFFKPADDPALPTGLFKTEVRRKLIADGYDIVANIGDQTTDVGNGNADQVFLVPNPFYRDN